MTKRKELVKKLIDVERKYLNCISNEGLIKKAANDLTCFNCPIHGEKCDKYEGRTCEEGLKAWFNEGNNDKTRKND